MAVTLRDVAREAGVSHTAVSFALRGTGRLDPGHTRADPASGPAHGLSAQLAGARHTDRHDAYGGGADGRGVAVLRPRVPGHSRRAGPGRLRAPGPVPEPPHQGSGPTAATGGPSRGRRGHRAQPGGHLGAAPQRVARPRHSVGGRGRAHAGRAQSRRFRGHRRCLRHPAGRRPPVGPGAPTHGRCDHRRVPSAHVRAGRHVLPGRPAGRSRLRLSRLQQPRRRCLRLQRPPSTPSGQRPGPRRSSPRPTCTLWALTGLRTPSVCASRGICRWSGSPICRWPRCCRRR